MKRPASDRSRSFLWQCNTNPHWCCEIFCVLSFALHTSTFFDGDGLLLNTANATRDRFKLPNNATK
jgi:hypothetical protein